MKNVKVEINGLIKEGVLIEDEHFWGGTKFVYEIQNGYSSFTAVNIIRIVE